LVFDFSYHSPSPSLVGLFDFVRSYNAYVYAHFASPEDLALLQKRGIVPVGKPPWVPVFPTGKKEAALIENQKGDGSLEPAPFRLDDSKKKSQLDRADA
jgi:hypothetical protein